MLLEGFLVSSELYFFNNIALEPSSMFIDNKSPNVHHIVNNIVFVHSSINASSITNNMII